MRSPTCANTASAQPARGESSPSRQRGVREASGDGINRGLSTVQLR